MSLREFWTSVRTAAGFLLPPVAADSPRIDTDQLEARLRRVQIWLTPKSVEGFHVEDFPFLDEGTRGQLSRCVQQFVNAAEQVPPDKPATEEQVQVALPAFLCILEIMRPDKYGDLDAFIIGKRIERDLAGHLPDWVHELRFETGDDANGDPAVWIWVELADAAAEKNVFSQHTREIRTDLVDCVRRLGVERWPYVHFRTVSERASADEEDQA